MKPIEANAEGDDRTKPGKGFWIHHVQTSGEGPQDFVTLLPPAATFAHGIIPEAVVGKLKRPLKEGEAIKPENFLRNKVFNDFLHEFIAAHGPGSKDLQAEARRQGEGWVYLIDARTANPKGKIPPADILGAFEVKAGRLVARFYKPNPNHALLSGDGFFRLSPELFEPLVKELTDRNARRKSGGAEPERKK